MDRTKKNRRPRGRPRQFDLDQAIATAQRLFHARGYDAVTVADLVRGMAINPPSFYAAFGSKTALFARVLDRYAKIGSVPLHDLLDPRRPIAECLGDVLTTAARYYAADPATAGCLVIESTRTSDPEVRTAAGARHRAGEDMVREYIAVRRPGDADRLADFISTVMAGMSANARSGHDLNRLLVTARLAGAAIVQECSADLPLGG